MNKKNLQEYVSIENMLTCWGGTDNYKFEFIPQNPNVMILNRDPEDVGDGNNNVSVVADKNTHQMGNGVTKKVSE